MRLPLPHHLAGRPPVLAWLLVPALACAPLPAPGPVAAQSGGVPETAPQPTAAAVLDSVLTTPPLDRAHWGVAVYDLSTGDPVLTHGQRRLFIAASTMKLVTTAAALDLLGPDYRFETVVEASIGSDGEAPSLTVIGGGDPSMDMPFQPHPLAPLDSLADSLAAAGIRRVAGPIIIDQSRFDSVLVHPAWETFDLDWYYAAPVTAMAVMRAAHEVVITPGAVGELARVALPYGTGLVTVDARVRTVPGSERWDDQLRRLPRGDTLVLRGTIGAGVGPDTSWIAQTDPGRTAGLALRRALERRGIAVAGPVEVRYTHPSGAGPAFGEIEARAPGEHADGGADERRPVRVAWRSPPLEAIIRVALERSDNWVTEQILKTLAAETRGQGSWRSGSRLIEDYLVGRVGVAEGAVYIRDGSGLTPQDLLTPDAVTALLRYADHRPWAAVYRSALASPGERESTLEDRLPGYGSRVEAKTGTLRHVNALSGYLRAMDGRELVFSILSNGSNQPSWRVQAAMDRIVESLLESGS